MIRLAALLALTVCCCSARRDNVINVHTASNVVFVGDSITAAGWFDENQSLVGGTDLLVQMLSSPDTVARVGAATGSVGAVTGRVGSVAAVTGGGQINPINSGVPGNQVADIEADIPGRITDYNPDAVVIEVGINDCRGVPIGPTPLVAFRASYDNILATVIGSGVPASQIACLSLLCLFEQWASAPPPAHFSGNPLDSGPGSIGDYDAEIQASALAHGCVYIDTRAAAGLLEATLNTPEPGAVSGILTGDGLHPNATGQHDAMSAVVYPYFSFTP